MVKRFSIVKLAKAKYDPLKVTEVEPTPRVLIIRTYEDSHQYLVRYPNGFVHRVNEDWVTTKSIFTPEHPEYPHIAKDMPAVFNEFRRNEAYQSALRFAQPNLAMDLEQRVEARNLRLAEQHTLLTPTTPIVTGKQIGRAHV